MREPKPTTSKSVTRAQEEWIAERDRQVSGAAQERARAEELWEQLEGSDPKTWREVVLEDPKYLRWGFCERLCNESAELAEDDPDQALELASLAHDLLPGVSGDKHLVAGMQEYVWKHVGNAIRARGELKKAGEAFERAREFFVVGISGTLPSLILRDRLAALESALHRDQGDLAEALKKIDEAVFHPSRHVRQEGSRPVFSLEKARLHRQLGQADKAFQALEWAERDAPASDVFLLGRIRIERDDLLCDLDRAGEVRKIPAGLRKAVERVPLERARLLCLDGRIAAGLGRFDEAQAALQKAWSARHDRALVNLALLTLEVAALAARQGRITELKSPAEQAQELVESPGLGRESAATLKLFSRLAAQEKLTAERATLFVRDFVRAPTRR